MSDTADRGARAAPPWQREHARLIRLIKRVASNTTGAVQGVVVEDPPFFGAAHLLDLVSRTFASHIEGPAAHLSFRHDAVQDWPSLVIEILEAAHGAGAPHGVVREDLIARREAFGDVALRDAADELMAQALERHGRLTLFAPNLDELLTAIGPKDQWAFRNVLQSHPLALIATAAAGFRPNRDEAFYEFFRLFQPAGYTPEDTEALAQSLGLKGAQTARLVELGAALGGRAELVETAASLLRTDADASVADLTRRLAAGHAPMLHATLATLAPQPRLTLAEATRLGLPAASGPIAERARLQSGAAAVQLSRLQDANILVADKSDGRNRQFDFRDPVVGALYRALVEA